MSVANCTATISGKLTCVGVAEFILSVVVVVVVDAASDVFC